MVLGEKRQLENVINEALKSGDVQPLHIYLQKDFHEDTVMKCSQQFVNKLDKLVNRSLDGGDPKAASLVLASLLKCGKNLKLYGSSQGLSGLMSHGLIDKMVQWFEKCKKLWVQFDQQWNADLLALSEDFFSALMLIHDACKEGAYKITESFLYPIGQLVADPRVYILIQKEAIHKFNLILDKMPMELKRERKLLTSQESLGLMMKLAGFVLDGGDYDFQSSLIESLFRMTTPSQRRELADRWFSMGHVASAFNKISDSEFETGCRQFLNMVNGMRGDRRRIYSYPCLEVYLGKYELLMPIDEKLEEFWIDFNLGSHSISLYFTLADTEESHWEAISVNENEVVSYIVTEKRKRKVLQITMSEVVIVGSVEGSSLSIHFSSSLDILQAACSIFGTGKNRTMPDVKSTMKENNTQVVPETQVSLSWSDKSTVPCILPHCPDFLQVEKMTTPAKVRISESTHNITCSGGRVAQHGGAFTPKLSSKEMSSVTRFPSYEASAKTLSHMVTPCSVTSEMSLQCDTSMKCTTFKKKSNKCKMNASVSEAISMIVSEQGDEHNFVPDSQPNMGKNTNKLSISEMVVMPTQKINLLPKPESRSNLGGKLEHHPTLNEKWSVSDSTPIWQKKLHNEVTQRLQTLLDEEKKNPHQEPASSPQKMTNLKVNCKKVTSRDQQICSLSATKELQVQRKESSGDVKKQSSQDVEISVVKTSMTKTRQKKTSSKNNSDDKSVTSSKMKSDMGVTGSVVDLISSHYKNKTQTTKDCSASVPTPSNHPLPSRPSFNTSWLSVSKIALSEAVNPRKTEAKPIEHRKGVFAFSIEAPLSFMTGEKSFTDSSATLNSCIHNTSNSLNKAKKGQPAEKGKWHVKKHLFSDTDTDNATMELSWLRESNRKPKPKVTQYSRQASVKKTAVQLQTSCQTSDLLPPSPKAAFDTNKLKKAVPKKTVKPQTATSRPQAVSSRPRRTSALSTKSYKEPDSDDSMSDTEILPSLPKKYLVGPEHREKEETHIEVPEVMKQKQNFSERFTRNLKKPEGSNQTGLKKTCGLKGKPPSVFQETSKMNRKMVTAPQEQENTVTASWVQRQTTCSLSPPPIEKLRSAERSAPTLGSTCSPLLSPQGSPLPASPDLHRQDSPPLFLLPPKCGPRVHRKGDISPSSFCRAGKSSFKTNSNRSLPCLASPRDQIRGRDPFVEHTAQEKSESKKQLSSVSQSPLSLPTQPLMTSTVIDLDKPDAPSPPQSPFPNGTINYHQYYGMSKASTPSGLSMSQSSNKSSVLTDRDEVSPVSGTEKTPLSKRGSTPHVSGPVRKRHFSLSDSEDDGKKKSKRRGQHSPRMKPRKLFKSFTEKSTMEMQRKREDEDLDEDLDLEDDLELSETMNPTHLYRQLSSEIKTKFQNRHKLVEAYNKQSLKIIQQHTLSISSQVIKHRSQKLGQVRKVLSEEISQLELDDSMLKNMEKDATVYWKKQRTIFHMYKKQEAVRNENLKRTLQSNTCHGSESEERIITSQMCLMRSDMKSAQDRLLSKMQEKEIESMKRGLHSLFFP